MRALKKTAIGLSLIALAFGAKAQNANDNRLAFNGASGAKTEVPTKKANLNAPIVKQASSTYDAVVDSRGENLSLILIQAEKDPISGERYAKGFANGFTDREKTAGNPMYVTANYLPKEDGLSTSFGMVFMDGAHWRYNGPDMIVGDGANQSTIKNGQDSFTIFELSYLIDDIMKDYVKKFGHSKIIPEGQKAAFVASLN